MAEQLAPVRGVGHTEHSPLMMGHKAGGQMTLRLGVQMGCDEHRKLS